MSSIKPLKNFKKTHQLEEDIGPAMDAQGGCSCDLLVIFSCKSAFHKQYSPRFLEETP